MDTIEIIAQGVGILGMIANFLSFQQKEVRSWVISLDNVILLFICALLDRDCGFSCLTPALLHSSASSPALKSTLFGQSTLHQRVKSPL